MSIEEEWYIAPKSPTSRDLHQRAIVLADNITAIKSYDRVVDALETAYGDVPKSCRLTWRTFTDEVWLVFDFTVEIAYLYTKLIYDQEPEVQELTKRAQIRRTTGQDNSDHMGTFYSRAPKTPTSAKPKFAATDFKPAWQRATAEHVTQQILTDLKGF